MSKSQIASDQGATPTSHPTLTIGQVAERTGVPVALLRAWEQRYGLVGPSRSANGQRRYHEDDCAVIADVVRRRAAGMSLASAVAAASAQLPAFLPAAELSIFASLRRQHPSVAVHVMPKRALLALTRSIEDECCARAKPALLLGAFQRRQFYEGARRRWVELARTASAALVFADFATNASPPGGPVEVALQEGDVLRREWALICDGVDFSACVSGWEVQAMRSTSDADRRFEVTWSVDPELVRDAARAAATLAELRYPGTGARLAPHLGRPVLPASVDLRRASALMGRSIAYLSR